MTLFFRNMFHFICFYIFEGLPGVLGEQGNTVDFTGTKQENHREQGDTKYIGKQSLFPGKNTNSIMT